MALSEVFNLDFKFGGNAEFLARLDTMMKKVDDKFDSFSDNVDRATDATEEMNDAVRGLDGSFKNSISSMSAFGDKLRDIASYYLSFQAARMGAERVWSFGMNAMDAYSTQERAENQLKGVMQNRGTVDQFSAIKDYAAEIQGRGIYGDEAMIKAAGELATYVKGTESIKSMMDLITNYAAGMTGGGEVSPDQMESLATGLGMAYDGNYMSLRRKGFDTAKLEALDAIVENGGQWGTKEKKKYGDVLDADLLAQIKAAGGVTEQMRVDALKESLKDWDHLYETVNELDSSALIKFNNRMGDLRENIGKRIYPVFNNLVESIDSHMPDIEEAFQSVSDIFMTLARTLEENLDTIKNVVGIFSKALEIVSKYPKSCIATALALKSLSSGALFAKDGFASLTTQMNSSLKTMLKMEGAIGALVGSAGAGIASGAIADISADKGFGGNAAGALGAMAMGAATGAAQFGLFGAAIGSTAATVTMLVRAIKELIAVTGQTEKFEKNEADKNAAFEKMMDARKRWKNSSKDDYASNYKAYVEAAKTYGEFTGGIMPSYIQEEMFAERRSDADAKKVAKASAKSVKGDLYQQFNTTNIEQNVSVAADLQKIGVMLNQSIRSLIEMQMKRNSEIAMVTR